MLTTQSLSLSLPVWRILYDSLPIPATKQLLILELRDKNQLKWCVFDCETCSLLWEKTFSETTWWTGAIGFYSGILLLHEYSGSDQPAPKKLFAINALTGEVNWVVEGSKFEQTDGINLQTSRLRPESAPIIEQRLLSTGLTADFPVVVTKIPVAQWQSPLVYDEPNQYYSVICRFIEKITGNTPEKAINYGEISGHVLFFYYFYSANAITLSRSLLVVNSTKTVLLHDTIHSEVESAAFGEYLYDNHHVVFLRKVDEITVIKLPRP
ncbi:DUF4905 domain-containing protein [Runella sp.]|uniref:DUF4905 domain-containing protein n=1 Tax=Runella sp. TaxID=1960881 RepID=UPI003D130BF3